MRSTCRTDKLLYAVTFRESRCCLAATLDGVKKVFGEPRHRRDTAIGEFCVERILRRGADAWRPAPAVRELEAAHVVGARIVQRWRAVLSEELDPVAGAEIG